MKEVESVGDYCVRKKVVFNKMVTLEKVVVVVNIEFRTLTPKWNHVIIIIEENKYLSILEFDQLTGFHMSHKEW